jgi:hypothetical protein
MNIAGWLKTVLSAKKFKRHLQYWFRFSSVLNVGAVKINVRLCSAAPRQCQYPFERSLVRASDATVPTKATTAKRCGAL